MINSINQTSYNIPAFKDINSNARIKEASETKNSAQNEIYEKLHSSTTFVPKHYASGIVDKDEYALFSSIDKQKTMDNVYKLFSQLTKDLQDKKGFTQEEIINTLPFAFDYDKKTLNVAKTYTLEEYQERLIKNKKNDENIESMITFYDYDLHSDELNLQQSENIFQRYGVDIGSQFYTNEDGTISKSGIFYAFYDRVANSVLEGETTIRGKLEGLDRNLSDDELKDLRKFLDENKLGNGGIFLWVDFGDSLEYEKLLNSNISIEEFKQKYLEFKERVEAKQERWHKESQDALQKELDLNSQNEQTEQSSIKKHSAIQAASKNQIYKDTGYFKFKDLLKNQQDLDTLSILFESIKSGKNKNFMSLLNGVDIQGLDKIYEKSFFIYFARSSLLL